MRLAIVVSMLWAGWLAAQAPAGEIRGTVMTAEGLPIAEAEIRVMGTGLSATSDAKGWFAVRGLDQGEFVVQARRIGYKAQQFGARLWREGEVKEVKIVLERGEYELPEIVVAARQLKPIEYGWTTRFDDFFRRKQVGLGHYILRDEIDRKGAGRTPSLLAGVRGVGLRYRHPGISGTDVTIAGCSRVSVWIDGSKQRYPDLPPQRSVVTGGLVNFKEDRGSAATGEYLQRVLPSQIEMMEIYRGPGEMPAEFLDDSCAAIAIWTR